MDHASGIPTSILSGTKFKIQQSVPTGAIKRGPHTIVRTADLNDGIEIKRRFGEGSKPLFADIPIKPTPVDSHETTGCSDLNLGCKSKSNRRSSSTESSSPERYRHRDNKKHSSPISSRRKSPGRSTGHERSNHNRDKNTFSYKSDTTTKTNKYRRTEKSKTRSPSPSKQKPVEKIPYYRDERRERERLRRLYGHSRSRSPPPTRRRVSPIAKRRNETQSRSRRSTSRERQYKYSPYRTSRRDYRRHRSRTPSKTRSPIRHERRKPSSNDVNKEQKEDANSLSTAAVSVTPQYIPIPVPVPADYASYSFAGWTPPQLPWHAPPHRPPPASHFVPFPIWPMIPPIRPPRQASFAGMPPPLSYTQIAPQYRPHASQRYQTPRHNTSNYQSRP